MIGVLQLISLDLLCQIKIVKIVLKLDNLDRVSNWQLICQLRGIFVHLSVIQTVSSMITAFYSGVPS